MFEKTVDIVADQSLSINTNNMEGGAGGNHARTLGMLAGRRVSLVGNVLHIPNTAPGRALATLLTGQTFTKNHNGALVVNGNGIGDVSDLLTLLTSISLAIQDESESPAALSPLLQLMLDFGIDRKIAVQLAADPWVTIERVTAWISYLDDNAKSFVKGGGIRGMLTSRLRDHIEAPYGPSAQQPALEEQTPDQSPQELFDDYDCEPLPEPAHPELNRPLASGRSPAAIWQTAYGELQLQMPRETFDTWLRLARLVAYNADTSTYTISVQSSYAQEWLERRLSKMMERTLSQVAGCAAKLCFVVDAAEQNNS